MAVRLIASFAVLHCLLSVQLGAESDFPPHGQSPTGLQVEAELEVPESSEQASRQARQSSPMSESFQTFRIGADAPRELHSSRPRSDQDLLLRSGRQFRLTDLDFEGFQFNRGVSRTAQTQRPSIQPAFQTRQPAFQNFQTVQFGFAPTQPTSFRRPQPTAPSFPSPPLPRRRGSRLPPNADPRARQRVTRPQDPQQPDPRQTSQQTSFRLPQPQPQQQSFSSDDSESPSTQRFQNFPGPLADLPERVRTIDTERRTRTRTRQRVVGPGPVASPAPQQFPTFNRGFDNRIVENERTVVVTENPLILKCLQEAERHATEIGLLENRTALHIDYAQEKQIEIELLEITLGAIRNQTKLDNQKIKNLRNSIQDRTNIIETKDRNIQSLKDDIQQLKATFEEEDKKKQEIILNLTERLSNTSTELADNKIALVKKVKENKMKTNQLNEENAKVARLKSEKKNLLKIVQQLAEIGNPSLNFNSVFIAEKHEEPAIEEDESSGDYDYEMLEEVTDAPEVTTKAEGSGDDINDYDENTTTPPDHTVKPECQKCQI